MRELDKKVLTLIGLMQVSLDILDEMESSSEYRSLFVRETKRDHNNFRKRLEKIIKNIYPIDDKIADKHMVEIHRAVSILVEKGIQFPE
jgi:hypothetical protein